MKNMIIPLGIMIGFVILLAFNHRDIFAPLYDEEENPEESVELVKEPNEDEMNDPSNHFHSVPSDQVCMVNNVFTGKKQTPVIMDNKIYYVCCGHCIDQLETDKNTRYAKDPHSGKMVDKANAFIVLSPRLNGDVVYFESESSLVRDHFRPVNTPQGI